MLASARGNVDIQRGVSLLLRGPSATTETGCSGVKCGEWDSGESRFAIHPHSCLEMMIQFHHSEEERYLKSFFLVVRCLGEVSLGTGRRDNNITPFVRQGMMLWESTCSRTSPRPLTDFRAQLIIINLLALDRPRENGHKARLVVNKPPCEGGVSKGEKLHLTAFDGDRRRPSSV